MPAADIDAVYAAHGRHADSVTGLDVQPWGERAFHVVLAGYRFPIAEGSAEPGDPFIPGRARDERGMMPPHTRYDERGTRATSY